MYLKKESSSLVCEAVIREKMERREKSERKLTLLNTGNISEVIMAVLHSVIVGKYPSVT